MTIATSTGRIQYNGNDVTTAFATNFKALDTAHVEVTLTSAAAVDTVQTISTDYTVALGASTATITMITPPATGEKLTLRILTPITQTYDLINGQAFNADTIETALDLGTQVDQGLQEQLDRCAKLPASDSTGDIDQLVADVVTVAANETNINTVAGINTEVTTVAGDSADIATVAGISSNVTTVAGISSDVTTVAADATDIGTVAGISSDITTAATNVVDITNFADVYIGPSASDPTTRTDASALQAGDLYFNTSTNVINYYTGSAWTPLPALPADLVTDITPQLGGMLDVNGNAIGDGTNELLEFVEAASAVNHVSIENAATGAAPVIRAKGDDTNVDLKIYPKGTGRITLDDNVWPATDGTVGQVLQTNGSNSLSFTDLTARGEATVISMKAADISTGIMVTTNENTTGNGGGAEYLISASGTADGYLNHLLANGNYAILQHNGTVEAEQIGMIGDGTTDNVLPFQEAWDQGLMVVGKESAVYGIATEVVYKRGGGFTGHDADQYYGTNLSDGTTSKATEIKWIGTATTGAMLRASRVAVGTVYSSAFSDSVWGLKLKSFVINGNDLADYGLYVNRAHGADVQDITATKTDKHGLYITGAFSGYYRKLLAFKNNGCGISIGRGYEDFGGSWSQGQANAATFKDLWGFSNGYDGTFDDGTNPLWGYGVGLWLHRANFVSGIRAENNDGPGLVFVPSSYSNSVNHVYTELNNTLDIGGGATAISEARATRKYGIWYSPNSIGGYGNSIKFGSTNSEYIRITGTNPSGRIGQPFLIQEMGGATGIEADWDDYVVKNSDINLTGTIVGTSPKDEIGANNGFIDTVFRVQAAGAFNAGTGAIVADGTYTNVASITYTGVGDYLVTFTDAMDDDRYVVICDGITNNRVVYVDGKTTTSFSIRHHAPVSTFTDSGADLEFMVIGKRSI